MNTLIVDDKKEGRYLLRKILSQHNFDTESAKNGKEALRKLRLGKFDIVISDILMPTMDGYQFCKRCKSDENLKDIIFIFYTATYTEQKDEDLAYKMGADGFIRKPLEPDKLMQRINKILEDKKEKDQKPSKKKYKKNNEIFDLYSQRLVKKLEHKMLKIEEKEKQYRAIFETTGTATLIINDDKTIALANNEASVLFGYSREELEGEEWTEFVSPQDLERLQKYHKIRRGKNQGKAPHKYEAELVDNNGNTHDTIINIKMNPYTDQSVVSIVDITRLKKALNELENNKRLLDETEKISQTGGWDYNVKKDEMAWTDEVYKIYGVNKEDYDPSNIDQDIDFYTPEDQKKIDKAFKNAVNKGKPYDLELKFRSADSQKKWVRTQGNPVFEDGKVVRVFGHIIDVTEKKQAKIKLKEKEIKYRQIFNNANDAIYLHAIKGNGMPGKFIEVNDVACEMLGYSREEFLNMTPLDIDDSDQTYRLESIMENLMTKRKSTFEMRHISKSGQAIPVEINSHFFNLNKEKMILSVARDITERKKREQALCESEARYRTIFNTAAATAIMEANTNLSFVNRQFEELSGYTKEEIENKKSILDFIVEEDKKEMEKYLHENHRDQDSIPDQHEFHCRGKKGAIKSILMTFAQIPNSDKSVISLIDISKRKELEKELRQFQKMESIGRLTGSIAHDMNNILAPIIGYSEMLLQILGDDKKEKKYVKSIYKAGNSAKSLISQLLAFSRKQNINIQEIDLNKVIQDFKKLLKRTIHEDIEIIYNLYESLPLINADKGQIEQVIMNLAVNAGDAMPEGGRLTIETEVQKINERHINIQEDLEPGKYVAILVIDTGHGMDKDTMEKIFEPFYSTKGKKGTGMGLSTVYGIVKKHNGDIGVFSQKGQGTTFKVYFPVDNKKVLQKAEAENFKKTDLAGSETILIVEDNNEALTMAKDLLENQGYEILTAGNGEEALSKIKGYDGHLDLLLTDVVLPEINGKQLYQELVEKFPDLKLIYMSGYTDQVISQHGIIDQDINFIPKPYTIKKLIHEVRRVLNS